MMFLG